MNAGLQILLGLAAADFLTASMHWFEDVYLFYGRFQDSVLLRGIVEQNELHHFYPRAMLALDPIENIRDQVLLCVLILALLAAFAPGHLSRYGPFYVTFLVVATSANYVHRNQHLRDCERPLFWTELMRYGLLVGPSTHRIHHTESCSNYGIVLAPMNALYEATGVFRGLRFLLTRVVGLTECTKPDIGFYVDHYDAELEALNGQECPRRLTRAEYTKYTDALLELHKAKVIPACHVCP